jgi:serine/threonine-protein kinase
MGMVWRAWDHGRGHAVAVKTVLTPSPEALTQLKAEFRLAQQVVHPNLVALYELYVDGAQALFTMELVEGEPIAHLRASATMIRPHFGRLGAALDRLHRAGLVHGDLKSSNVLVQASGRVVLLDLGLVRRAGESLPQRRDGSGPVGTPGCLAPELYGGAPVTPSTDTYAFGALLYRCLAGQEATRGDSATRRWLAEGGWFPAPHELRAEVPRDLSDLAMGLLRPDPARRPSLADAAAVLAAPVRVDDVWIERPDARARLRSAWSTAQVVGETVLVGGPSGVGKSSLVRRFTETLGAPVCWGRASPVEHVPYQALDSALDALWALPATGSAPAEDRAHAERLFRRLGRGPETPLTAGEAAAGVRGLQALLEHLSAAQGLVLVVDDVQWADADSMGVLTPVVRAPPPGCLVILLARPEGLDRARGLFGARPPVEVPLGPLSVEAVARTLSPSFTAAELASLVRDGGVLPAALTLVRSSAAGTLDERLVASLAGLTPGCRRTLILVCLAASPLGPEHLPLLGEAEHDARALVDEGLLTIRSGADGSAALLPVHDLVRERVVGPDEGLEGIHEQLGRLFAGMGPPLAGASAHHFGRSGHRDRAAERLDVAARYALAQGAFDWSARLFEQAEAMGAPTMASAEPRGMALASARRHQDAIAVWLSASVGSAGLERVRLLSHAIDLLMGGGHFDRGHEALRGLMAEVGERLDGLSILAFVGHTLHAAYRTRRPGPMAPTEAQAVRLEALWTAANSLTPFDPVAGQAIHARHRALSFAFGDARHRAQAMGSQLLFRQGQAWSVERELAILRDLLLWVPDGVRGYVWGCRGYGLRLGCDFAASVEVLEHALTFFGDQKQRYWYSRFGQVSLLLNDAYHAPIAELARRAEATVEDAEARQDRAARVGVDLSIGWLVRLLRDDDPTAAWAVLDALPGVWGRELQVEQQLRLAIAQAQILLYEGRLDDAAALLDRPPRAVKRLWRFRLIPFYWHLCRGRLALMRGEHTIARRSVRALEALGEPAARGAAGLLTVGLLRADQADSAVIEEATHAARRRLDAQRHSLLAHALADDGLTRLAAHGVKDPARASWWITGCRPVVAQDRVNAGRSWW